MPITRLVHGLRFALGLWVAVPRISRELEGAPTRDETALPVAACRLNLLDIPVMEFEDIIRELFAKLGLRSQITQITADGGVDAVANNDAPIIGGPCIIQVKRYRMPVSSTTVGELIGTIESHHAVKGILITTSSVTNASRDLAARYGRIDIIDGQGLKMMLREHLGLDAVIAPPADQ